MSGPIDARDRGFITIWGLGLAMILLFFGFLSLDLWHGFSERRQLAAAADQAAQAGANALDTGAFRSSGTRQLDPDLAEELAWSSLGVQGLGALSEPPVVLATTESITVTLDADVESGLLGLFDLGSDAFHVTVTATGYPTGDLP